MNQIECSINQKSNPSNATSPTNAQSLENQCFSALSSAPSTIVQNTQQSRQYSSSSKGTNVFGEVHKSIDKDKDKNINFTVATQNSMAKKNTIMSKDDSPCSLTNNTPHKSLEEDSDN